MNSFREAGKKIMLCITAAFLIVIGRDIWSKVWSHFFEEKYYADKGWIKTRYSDSENYYVGTKIFDGKMGTEDIKVDIACVIEDGSENAEFVFYRSNNDIIKNDTQDEIWYFFELTGNSTETVYGIQLSAAQCHELNVSDKLTSQIVLDPDDYPKFKEMILGCSSLDVKTGKANLDENGNLTQEETEYTFTINCSGFADTYKNVFHKDP